MLLTGPDGPPCVRAQLTLSVFSIGGDADFVDERGGWLARAGIGNTGALLARPEGYFAWRSRRATADLSIDLRATLANILSIA